MADSGESESGSAKTTVVFTTKEQNVDETNIDLWNNDIEDELLVLCDGYDVDGDSEISNVEDEKTENIAKKINNGGTGTPLERFRPGYLWVSDFTKQNWCEQQLYYSFTVPSIVEENPVMTEGTNLHLDRELAVHDTVQVKVTSNKDIWAIKMINMLSTVQGFLNGVTLAREVPIFGAPFQEDVFFVGIIDELRFDPASYSIDLSELKTKIYKSPPSKAQKSQHKLQVQLYKKLFDDLVKGCLAKSSLAKHLHLNLTNAFGEGVSQELSKHMIEGKNLDELLDILFLRMQALTCICQLHIEYVHQDSKATLYYHTVNYDEEELFNIFHNYLKFWRGQRAVCDFADICEWRAMKSVEYCSKNTLRNR